MNNHKTIAIDLAKDVFEVGIANRRGRVIEQKRLSRAAFERYMDLQQPAQIIMEACGSSDHWGRRFQRQGHEVRLLPARDVKPYVRGKKTDRNDVSGMIEAKPCAALQAVPVKSAAQQGVLTLHRIREHMKSQRTATANLLRGVLREFGIVIPMGMTRVIPHVRAALEDGDNAFASRRDSLPIPSCVMTDRHGLGETSLPHT